MGHKDLHTIASVIFHEDSGDEEPVVDGVIGLDHSTATHFKETTDQEKFEPVMKGRS